MTAAEFPHPKDKVVILKRIPVLASCTEVQLLLIAERTRLVEYKKGEYVYREGDRAEAFYIVISGRLRVFSKASGAEKTFTVLHNGDSFGEISLLTGETHSAMVQALNDTLVLELQKSDFDEVINRIPSLVLHLSRMLSKRLRARDQTSEFPEATIAAIYSGVKGVGRTLFAVSLAALLTREIRRKTVILDMNPEPVVPERLHGSARPSETRLAGVPGSFSEAQLAEALAEHPFGFDVLSVGSLLSRQPDEQPIAPLLSALTRSYRYILIDLPVEVDAQVLKCLTQSDLIYLLTSQDQDDLVRTKALLHRVQEAVGAIDQRIKVVVNLMGADGPQASLKEIGDAFPASPLFVLPQASSGGSTVTAEEVGRLLANDASPYTLAVHRIARNLSGMTIGLALGSGAALGLAHVGILKVIERERIPIDIIAGSSIGALIAGLWAAGNSADELERMALRFKNPWDIRKLFVFDFGIPVLSLTIGIIAGVLTGWLGGFWVGFLFGFMVCVALGLVMGPLVGGPIQGAQLMAKLQQDFAGKTFEQTWLPLKIVAANPKAREEVIFDSGPIADAVRASVSIPGIFKPVMLQGRLCLDGGVVNPVPVSVLKQAGAHRVIAVNVFPTTSELTAYRQDQQHRRAERELQLASKNFFARMVTRFKQELARSMSPLIFDVIMRSMQAMEYQIAEVACHDADLTLRPTVAGAHWLEFFHPEPFIRRGEEEALRHLGELKRLAWGADRDVDNP